MHDGVMGTENIMG